MTIISAFCCFFFLFSGAKLTVAQTAVFEQRVPVDDITTHTWTADNGNGSFTNPLFYEEFSDPDMIRVGDDYYLTGTTNHAMPGLPVLHSKDLVNWTFLSYAVNRLNLGPEYRLESGKDIYGQGIWAPSFRYHKGTFYIFSNVNGRTTQLFTATNAKGPWKQTPMKRSFHDLSVLFDDDGKTYVVWGYDEIRLAELTDDLLDIVSGSEQVIVPKSSGAGEGCHFYKINGRYYITNTNYDPLCYQVCLRANNPRGPYEVNVMSAEENLGVGTGYKMRDLGNGQPITIIPPLRNFVGSIPMHQGGIIQIQNGDWWGWSMLDHNSIGRVTALSPVTWQNDWPYFGLPGNLTRSPRSWIKPQTGFSSPPHAVYQRSDDFSSTQLLPVWQWNHVPVENKWTLDKRKGYLRLNSLPAENFFVAKNTLTQRAVGPEEIVTTELEGKGLQAGDIAGLALLNYPYTYVGLHKTADSLVLEKYDQQNLQLSRVTILNPHVWLRVHCNYDTEKALFSYSTDGEHFITIGDTTTMIFQLRTFQGVRTSLFNFNNRGIEGGYADFNNFIVFEPRSFGLTRQIPDKQLIQLTSLADSTVLVNWKNFVRPVAATDNLVKSNASKFRVLDRGNGRIALQSLATGGFVTVKGLGVMAQVRIEKEEEGEASLFQWQDMLRGDLMLMSLKTHRYLFADPFARSLTSADSPGTTPDRKDGSCFSWILQTE